MEGHAHQSVSGGMSYASESTPCRYSPWAAVTTFLKQRDG